MGGKYLHIICLIIKFYLTLKNCYKLSHERTNTIIKKLARTLCGVFSNTNSQFSNSDTKTVSSSSFQFWCCLPGVSVISHRLEDLLPRDCPHFKYQSQVLSHPYCWPITYKLGVPTTPSSFLLEWLTEFRKSFYLYLLVDYKEYKWIARWWCSSENFQKNPELLFLCGVGVAPAWPMAVYTSSEALCISFFRDCYGDYMT